jgi:hypothetical protein
VCKILFQCGAWTSIIKNTLTPTSHAYLLVRLVVVQLDHLVGERVQHAELDHLVVPGHLELLRAGQVEVLDLRASVPDGRQRMGFNNEVAEIVLSYMN